MKIFMVLALALVVGQVISAAQADPVRKHPAKASHTSRPSKLEDDYHRSKARLDRKYTLRQRKRLYDAWLEKTVNDANSGAGIRNTDAEFARAHHMSLDEVRTMYAEGAEQQWQ